MSIVRQLLILVVLVGVAGGAWWWFAGAGSEDRAAAPAAGPRPVAVEVAEVRVGEVAETIEAVGTARAHQSIDVVPADAGFVAEILFETGQRVTRGQTLVRLDSRIDEANVAEARAMMEDARAQLERARQLAASRAVAQARIDELTALFTAAEARLAAAEQRLRDRSVVAPFDGIVGLREVDLGARVTEDTVLTRLDDLSVVQLEFEVPELFFGRIRPGQPVDATSATFPDKRFAGSVAAIDTRIDRVTRSFRVRADLPNQEGMLPGGLFMVARITLETRPDALLVPEEAVVAEGRSHFVYVVRDQRAERVEVRLGERRVGEVEIAEGLQAGDLVVTGGLQRLRPGVPVRLPDTAPARPAEAVAERVG